MTSYAKINPAQPQKSSDEVTSITGGLAATDWRRQNGFWAIQHGGLEYQIRPGSTNGAEGFYVYANSAPNTLLASFPTLAAAQGYVEGV